MKAAFSGAAESVVAIKGASNQCHSFRAGAFSAAIIDFAGQASTIKRSGGVWGPVGMTPPGPPIASASKPVCASTAPQESSTA